MLGGKSIILGTWEKKPQALVIRYPPSVTIWIENLLSEEALVEVSWLSELKN
jgi:hypothetical protein